MTALEKAKVIYKALDDKKASNIKILDISGLTTLTEYFVICSCTSSVQVRACVDEAEEKLEELGERPHHKEGYSGGSWILADFGDVIVHVMQEETREFYNIERLWEDAPEINPQ